MTDGNFAVVNIQLNIEDYVIDGLDLAPAKIAVGEGGKQYAVDYCFMQVDGSAVPTGVVTVPVGVYRRNAYEFGQPSKFPTLP